MVIFNLEKESKKSVQSTNKPYNPPRLIISGNLREILGRLAVTALVERKAATSLIKSLV